MLEEKLFEPRNLTTLVVSYSDHSLGQWIRNNWCLWEKGELFINLQKMGFIHPDDMSSSIITEYWNRLHNYPSQIEDDIEQYKEFWKKVEK